MHLRSQSHAVKAQPSRRSTSWSGGALSAGFGTQDLRLGSSAGEVESLLGSPDEKLALPGHYFYVYRRAGVDVDFGRIGGSVQRLFFYDKGIERHTDRAPVEIRGVRLGTNTSAALDHIGEPDRRGGPVRVGRRTKTWFYHNGGLQFDFDLHHHVITISVNTPTEKVA